MQYELNKLKSEIEEISKRNSELESSSKNENRSSSLK